MNFCYLALGSNLQSPERQIRQALLALKRLPCSHLIKIAKLHHSRSWGRKAQPVFVNTVVGLQTTLTPQQLLLQCQKIEKKQGRVRRVYWGSRTIDIDILLYGSLVMKSKQLSIPHPRMHLRDFVFIPLLEIATKPISINGILLNELAKNTDLYLTIRNKPSS